MKNILLIISISFIIIACSDIGSVNAIKHLENFVKKIEENPNTDICEEGFPLLSNVINNNGYRKNALQIIELLNRVPQIKKCSWYNNIEETLGMAIGYKNIPWGSSLEDVRKNFGKISLSSDRRLREKFLLLFRRTILDKFQKNSFRPGTIEWKDTLFAQLGEIDDIEKILSSSMKIYRNDKGTFLFYNNAFFACSFILPYDEDNLYLYSLRNKYGKDSFEQHGIPGMREDIRIWLFGNTSIMLRNDNNIIYVDRQLFTELYNKYMEKETNRILSEQAETQKRQQQTKAAASNL